jgi:c(7)-type cytochrome triheme protein
MDPHAMTPAPRRGFARTSALGLLAGALVVTVAAFEAVHAEDPGRLPARPTATGEAPPDPSTEAGQRAIEGAHFGRRHTPSSILFPDQSLPLRFSHEVHLGLLECKDCHASAYGSVRARDVNLPPEATCFDCHDAEKAAKGETVDPPASCDTCHPGYVPEWLPGADFSDTKQVKVFPAPVVIPEPHVKFNHRVHIDRGIGCESCHGDMTKVGLATRDNALPIMETCIGCHDGKAASDACRTCHLTTPDGRIDWDLPGGKLEPEGWYYMDAHDEDWLYSHRAVSTIGDQKCESCHTQQYCLDCHNGVQKPLKVHPNNWITQHVIPAKRNEPECSSCHRSQTFCVDCHQATKVSNYEPNRPAGNMQFHPEGWVEFRQRGPNHHAFEAQKNIRACASCHTEASCIACHATAGVGGINVNPHPPGWTGSAACVRMRDKNERVCYKCHTPMDQAMRCGR